MVPSGTPTPIGGSQSVTSSLLQSNSGALGAQGGPLPSQPAFPSLVSPRSQFNNMNVLGNVPSVSSLINQSFGGGPNSVLPSPGGGQRTSADIGSESDPLSSIGLNAPTSFMAANVVNPSTSGQAQGQQYSNPSANQMLGDQQQAQQSFQQGQQPMQQFSGPMNAQQPQFQSIRGGLTGVGPVKMEPQVMNDKHGQQLLPQQQLQSPRNIGPVKLEQQQFPPMRGLGQVKVEPQRSDQSLFLQQQQQQQQQQQLLHMSQQSSHAAAAQINLLQQQRFLQLQQQQQQQIFKVMPQQRPQLPQQYQQQNMPLRPPMKPLYEPGTCARRLTQYMCQQRHRPEDNNIEFWRRFVAEYFAPNARKKWCVSMYGNGRPTTGVFPQDVWHCEICNRKPGRGFEATAEVLPRLFKIKYESGTLEELLYIDMPQEHQNSSGQIVLDYAKAIQESVFEHLRVVRDGQLRIVFSSDLKICSWEFCARRHDELIPRRLLIPQIGQLGSAAQKYQQAAQNASSSLSVQELQNNCNAFVASARQLAKALEVPLVNDLGYTKRYVRCLQISEVVNSMKDLIDYSRATGTGPIESLMEFSRRSNSSPVLQGRGQQHDDQQKQQQQQHQQQALTQTSNNDQSTVQCASSVQLSTGNGMMRNNSFHAASAPTSSNAVSGLLHQNSMNGHQASSNNPNSPYGGNPHQMPSPSSSSNISQTHQNPSPFQTHQNPSPFQSPTPSSNNNPPQQPQSGLSPINHVSSANSPANMSVQHPAPPVEPDPHDSQSSVQKILQDMMMNNQLNGTGGMLVGGSLGYDIKNRILPASNSSILSSGSPIVGNGGLNHHNHNLRMSGSGFGMMGSGGLGQSATMNGIRGAMANSNTNPVINGRMRMAGMSREQSYSQQQQDHGNQVLSGVGAVKGFNSLQFDWKPSP